MLVLSNLYHYLIFNSFKYIFFYYFLKFRYISNDEIVYYQYFINRVYSYQLLLYRCAIIFRNIYIERFQYYISWYTAIIPRAGVKNSAKDASLAPSWCMFLYRYPFPDFSSTSCLYIVGRRYHQLSRSFHCLILYLCIFYFYFLCQCSVLRI